MLSKERKARQLREMFNSELNFDLLEEMFNPNQHSLNAMKEDAIH